MKRVYLVTFESDGAEYREEKVVAVASSLKKAKILAGEIAIDQGGSSGRFRYREVFVDVSKIRYFDDLSVGKVIEEKVTA